MESLINWKIISHPINWATLFLMVFISTIFVTMILSAFSVPKPDAKNS